MVARPTHFPPLPKASSQPQKVFFHTFGCQMNVYDTGKMRVQLARDGFVTTDDPAQAELIIVNTCSIRDKAEQKMHSAVGRYRQLKERGQRVLLGIGGCVAQQEGETLLKRYKDVDLVFGPDGVPQIRELVAQARSGSRVLGTDFLDLEHYPFVSDVDVDPSQPFQAFVTIQKGCDNKCTFCIVPTTRGVEVSRASGEIVAEVQELVARGVREVTLIGQNVNSYGLKLSGEKTFAQLLYAVAAVPGLERVRYTTSHPRDMGDDVVQAYRDLPQLSSHLHLPVQSGSDTMLRRMKRYYTREDYLRVVDALRGARSDLSLTTDVIVGFPGESDEDFDATMSLLEEVRFDGSFSFKYSPRPGTPALRLKDAVPKDVASDRLTRFQARQRELSEAYHRTYEGRTVHVLVEGQSRYDEGVVCGRTSTNVIVNFPGAKAMIGTLMHVNVTRGFVHSCRGEVLVPAVG